jgi:16S rRNA processing protein RimM
LDFISIGTIAGSHGVQGWCKVKNFGESWSYTKTPFKANLQLNLNQLPLVIEKFEIKPDYILIQVEGVHQPEFWDSWRNGKIQISRKFLDTIPLEKNEFYHFQLENLKVMDEDLQDTGYLVIQVTETNAHTILVVAKNGNKILIPFLNEWVGEISIPDGYLVVKGWEDWLAI